MYDPNFIQQAKLFKEPTNNALKALPGYKILETAIKLRAYNDIDQKKFLEVAWKGLERANKNHNKLEELNFIHDLGWHYYKIGEFDTAFYLYAHGFATSTSLKSKEHIARFNVRIGEIYIRKTNYDRALKFFFKVLKEEEHLRHEAYFSLAPIYTKEEEYETGLEYLDLAFRFNRKEENYDLLALNLVGIGEANIEIGNYAQAIKFFANSLQVTYVYPYPYSEVLAVMGSAKAILKMGHPEFARFLYEYANEICELYGFKFLYVNNLIWIGHTYIEQQEFKTAITHLTKAKKFAHNHCYDLRELEALESICSCQEQLENHKEAKEVLSEISSLKILLTRQEMEEKLKDWVDDNEKELEFLRMKARALEQQNDDLGQYVKVISHDIRQPLRNIGSFSTLLKRRYGKEFNKEANEFLDYILDGAFRMDELLNTLFDYVTLGTKETFLERTNLNTLINEVLEDLSPKIIESKAVLKIGKLPSVLGQKDMLFQLFYLLLDNAIKFRNENRPVIEITSEFIKGEHKFSIKDNGMGIHPDFHEKVFLLFSQLDIDDLKGTGSGLPISKKIVLIHGGAIWLTSNVGEGTTVSFTLKSV